MFSNSDGYSYFFKNKKNECDGTMNFVRHTYTFKSTRSNQTYIIEVDEFEDYLLFVVKFYLKAHRYSDKKFNLHTKYQEAPSCISTCINLMVDLYKENPFRSFAFIGASSEGEKSENTKRFRLYKRVMEAIFSPITFKHFQHPKSSAYLLLNKIYADNNPTIRDDIEVFFLKHYDLIL
jgi:hypothetical protein